MSLKSLVLASLLGLLFLVLGGAQPGRETPAQRFQRQHIDFSGSFPKRNPYCTQWMGRRNMTQGSCKSFNTFVYESWQQVEAVCRQNMTPCKNGSNMCWKSNSRMRITECTWNRRSSPPNCVYTTNSTRKYIIIACRGRPPVPVHFDDSV